MKNLQHTLTKVNALGITNKETLSLNAQLYTDLFTTLDQFITRTVFRDHSNINKLTKQKELGVDIDEVRMDCIERIITKLDYYLSKPLSAMIPLMYSTCSRIIIDSYRAAKKRAVFIVSLDQVINSNNAKDSNDSNKSKTLNDYIMDTKASPETKYMAKEAVIEIYQKHCHNADNLLCDLAAKVFVDKPSELTSLLIEEGSVDNARIAYENDLLKIYGISKSELPIVTSAKTTGLSKLLNKTTPDPREIAGKISNITNRIK